MAYTINKYDGSQVTVIADGTIDNTLDIKLIGKNYAGYGEVQNENLVFLLENFANTTQPSKPIRGQIWFDSGTRKLKFYDGTKFRTTGGAEISATAPTGLTTGDFWYDTTNDQLYAWNGVEFILIGPQGVSGSGTTQMLSRSVLDDQSIGHAIIEAVVNDKTVYIISADAFTLSAINPITGFTAIKKGLTLAYSSTGVTATDDRFWGTATDSDKLGGVAAANYVQSGSANFNTLVRFSDLGYTVGNNNNLKVFIESSTDPIIQNQVGDKIIFRTTVASVTRTPLRIIGNDILPGLDNSSDVGTTSFKFRTIYANSFNGTATQASALDVSGTFRVASTSATSNSIAARDGSGNLYATLFQGEASQARYADLAEKYLADAEYEVGTVVVVGGEKEVTASVWGKRALGAVSANPAYMMNSDLEGGTYIALKGRVPVKVIGSVKKGDNLIAANDGCASVAVHHSSEVFAIALESSTDSGVKLVEAVIL
jgi:hypothetical protein